MSNSTSELRRQRSSTLSATNSPIPKFSSGSRSPSDKDRPNIEPIYFVPRPEDPVSNSTLKTEPTPSSGELSMPRVVAGRESGLLSALEMTGVNKLHRLGIKGKGIKIGIIDTGIDYRHPALGGGFGPGFKVEGGYSFIDDEGVVASSPDPLATCLLGGHGTHVAGIVGMIPLNGTGFDIVGVAPEASIYAYRVFGCNGDSGSYLVLAAMSKALEDGVDVLSMSFGGGMTSWLSEDIYQSVVTNLKNAGVSVMAASGNYGSYGIYSQSDPARSTGAISVGSVANSRFPLVYSAVDDKNQTIPYASVWPLESEQGKSIYIVSPGLRCRCMGTCFRDRGSQQYCWYHK
ncbi:hypothetical protein LZ554_009099 [Drepanopeziza brunnea f. sp. 'monogermtubi']|nr:hypothetical protein LZ554_009099 [Drepanopeziza brunnea f. sp. 'monogermtubi']